MPSRAPVMPAVLAALLLAPSLATALGPPLPPTPSPGAVKLWAVDLLPGEASGVAAGPLGETYLVGTAGAGGALWRLDPLGRVAWRVDLPKAVLHAVAALPRGGAVAVGSVWDEARASPDALAVAVDGDGQVRWTRVWGTGLPEVARAVAASLGVVAVAGASGPHAFVSRFDAADGTPRWTWSSKFEAVFGDPLEETAQAVAVLPDERIAAAGWTYDGQANKGFVLALDAPGGRRWVRTLAAPAFASLRLHGLAASPAGDLVAAGQRAGPGNLTWPVVASWDPHGQLRWQATLLGEEGAWATGVAADAAGGALVVGTAREAWRPASHDWLLARLGTGGTLAWSERLDTGGDDYGNAVAWSPGGLLTAAGAATGYAAAARWLDAPARAP